MTSADEDEIWRSIVENYGERALPDPERRGERPERTESTEPDAQTPPFEAPFDPQPADEDEQQPAAAEPTDADESDAFVPPPAPPAPQVAPSRRAAWIAVIGVPVTFVLLALTGRSVSGPMAVLLLTCMVAGFVHLVWTMPKEPRDPFDDGSRV